MKLASFGLGAVATILLLTLLFAWVSRDVLALGRTGPPPESGMALIEAFKCHRAETKHATMRGVEDKFSSLGDEPARPHPRLANLNISLLIRESTFDRSSPDGGVTDYFELPASTVSGLIVVKMRPLERNDNDVMVIGDFKTLAVDDVPAGADVINGQLPHHRRSGRWRQAGDLYWASISDLDLNSGRTLLDLIQTGGAQQVIDVHIADDTAVDFMAVVSCEKPDTNSGVTLRHLASDAAMARDIAMFSSEHGDPGKTDQVRSDPFVGDQSCETKLPLLCYADRSSPAPESLPIPGQRDSARHWSGGEVAGTVPVRGDSFRTITDADRHCATRFGREWRTAEWAEGGFSGSFAARTGGRRFSGRYWIDIRGQPYGTCWRRADGSR